MKKVLVAAVAVSALLATSCGGNGSSSSMVSKGSRSKMDSLSYAIGANVGQSMKYQLSDVPFDMDELAEGFEDAVFAKKGVSHQDAMMTLQNYFMSVRPARAAAVAATRDIADSTALANGVSEADVAKARAEMPADESMFATKGERDSVSYAFGVDLGSNILNSNIPLQTVWVVEALEDAYAGESKMDEQKATAFIQNYFTVTLPANNEAAADEWFAELEKEKGVYRTESGLLYRIEKEGDANVIAVDDADAVRVNYTGKLRSGKVFDTSRFEDRTPEQQEMMKAQDPEGYDGDKSVEFPLNRVIPGWTEGMKLVGKGGRISLWIPSDLAYGDQGTRGIGPKEALYFDVEVLDVIPANAEPQSAE